MTAEVTPGAALLAMADALDPPAWEPEGRPELLPHQVPPEGGWSLWILAGGRGAGKTEGAARFFAKAARAEKIRGLIFGPTLGDVVEACIEGPSGLLAQDPGITFRANAPGGPRLEWPNGSEALCLGTPTPRDVDRLRAAGNRHLLWLEEAAANPQLAAAWDMAQLGLRLGPHPRAIISTTPRPTKAYRELLELPGTVVTRGSMESHPGISEERKEALKRRYAGTRLGRQELAGELIEDVDGALWTWAMIEAAHASTPDPLPAMRRIVVAVDPAVTSGEDADSTGIVVVGKGADGRGYVLEDCTVHAKPAVWARTAVAAYERFQADRIVAERNQGGDMVEGTIRMVSRFVPVTTVHATRSKRVRAEPVAAAYEQGLVSHVTALGQLEDELVSWTPDMAGSPDRLDALVWGITALGIVAATPPRTTPRDQVRNRDRGRPETAGMEGMVW